MTTIDAEKLALGWGKIAEGAMEISLAYSAIDTSAARADAAAGEGATAAQPSSPAAPVASVAVVPPPAAEAITECPKHHVPFEAGQYGPYCKQGTDDPAWGKAKGDRMWCRITPKNAPDYLRMQAA